MIEGKYWKDFYKTHKFEEPSSFAHFCLDSIDGEFTELGSGDGRDLYFFLRNGKSGMGVDGANDGLLMMKEDVATFIKQNKSTDNIYTRFFWHAIEPELQKKILKWTKKRIFIEARTIDDKPKNVYGVKHKRYLVDPEKLKADLIEEGFTIKHLSIGYGLSPFLGEDPQLIRVIAEKLA